MPVICSRDQLEALRQEWDALAAPSASPLLDHDWICCAATAFHDPADLRIFTVMQDGRLAAAAPMAIDRSHGRRLVMIGSSALYEPSGWLFSSEAALAELARQVAHEGLPFVVQRVAASSSLSRRLPGYLRGRAVTIDRPAASSFGVPTRGSWRDFTARLSSRTTRKLAGLRERSERELGGWDCTMHDPGFNDVAGLFEALVTVEGSGWKGRQGSSLAGRPDLFRFFEGYARRAAERARLRISVLRLGSQVAAVELAVEAHGRLWGLKIAYDEQFSPYAPALQLAHASIQSACARGLESYEFLGSAESWQERWKPESRHYRVMALYPVSIRGLLGLASDGVATLARRGRARKAAGKEQGP